MDNGTSRTSDTSTVSWLTLPGYRRYGIVARVLEDSPKVLLSHIGPKVQYRVPATVAPVIRSFSAIKPAKLEAIFEKSRIEAIEQRTQNGLANGEHSAGEKSFVSLDRGLGMLVEAEWLGAFISGMLRHLVEMASSES